MSKEIPEQKNSEGEGFLPGLCVGTRKGYERLLLVIEHLPVIT